MTMMLVGAVSLVGCSSTTSTSTSTDSGSTTNSPSTTALPATTVAGATTTAAPTTVKATVPATAAPATNPPATAPSGPQVSANFSTPAACAAPDVTFQGSPPSVTITWQVTGADSVYVAIDNENGPYESGLAMSGSTTVPYACPGPHTYYVVADKGGQRTVKSKSFP